MTKKQFDKLKPATPKFRSASSTVRLFNPTKRLRAIAKNIVKHEGDFDIDDVPEKRKAMPSRSKIKNAHGVTVQQSTSRKGEKIKCQNPQIKKT